MKLRNKLLPLVGVATACAAVAPIALTSCTSNKNGWVNLINKYTPTVKALDNQTLTTTLANKAYFGDETDGWKSDDQVIAQFKDDYYWWTSKSAISEENYDSVKVNFEYFYVNHQKYTPTDTTIDPYYIPTFTVKMNYEYEYTSTNSSSEIVNIVESGKVECVNVPYAIKYIGIPHKLPWEKAWTVGIPDAIIHDNEESTAPIVWTYNIKFTTTTTYIDTETETRAVETEDKNEIYYKGCDGVKLGELLDRQSIKPVSHYLYSVQYKA